MNLTIYDKKNRGRRGPLGARTEWMIAADKLNRTLRLSTEIHTHFGRTGEVRITFANDIDTQTWYICFDDDEKGYKTHAKTGLWAIYAATVAHRLCEIADENAVYAKFLVSRKPVKIDGRDWYKILTKHPLNFRK